MDGMFFLRWVPNDRLLTEQIRRHDVTQKKVTIVPDELFTLLSHSTTRLHIQKLGNHERHSIQNSQISTFCFISRRNSYLISLQITHMLCSCTEQKNETTP